MATPLRWSVLGRLSFLVLLPACSFVSATSGDDLPAAALDSLQAGVSTEDDVIRLVGPPGEVARLSGGSLFVYRLTKEASRTLEISYAVATGGYHGDRRRFGALVILFDRKGIVTGWGLSHPG